MSKIELLCIDTDGTMTDGSLVYGFVGNSFWGMQFRTCENFGESTDSSLVLSPKFSQIQKPHRHYFDCDSQRESATNQAQNCNSPSLRGVANAEAIQNKNQSARSATLKASSGAGVGVVREGEGSDFAIQAPTPSLKENAHSQKGEFNADLSAESRKEIDCFGESIDSPRNDESHESVKKTNAQIAEIAKVFNVKDGLALAYWAKTLNRKVAIITGRSSEILRARAKELGIDELLFMGIRDKGAKVRELKERFALDSSQIATIGDDLNDIPMFKESHFNFAPSDCAEAMKILPHTTILNAKGGKGAVREAIEIILKKESLYEAFVSQFV